MGEFRKLDERELHAWPVGRLMAGLYESPTGEQFHRTVVRTSGAVSVVPIDIDADGAPVAILIRQYRASFDRYLWEVPAGLRDQPGEDPAETGRRELAEEIGYEADNIELLTVFHPSAGMTDATHHVFLATGLRHVGSTLLGPEEEHLDVVRIPLGEALGMVWRGEIAAASAVIGLLMAAEKLGAARS